MNLLVISLDSSWPQPWSLLHTSSPRTFDSCAGPSTPQISQSSAPAFTFTLGSLLQGLLELSWQWILEGWGSSKILWLETIRISSLLFLPEAPSLPYGLDESPVKHLAQVDSCQGTPEGPSPGLIAGACCSGGKGRLTPESASTAPILPAQCLSLGAWDTWAHGGCYGPVPFSCDMPRLKGVMPRQSNLPSRTYRSQ